MNDISYPFLPMYVYLKGKGSYDIPFPTLAQISNNGASHFPAYLLSSTASLTPGLT